MFLSELSQLVKNEIDQLLANADLYGDGITMDFEKQWINVYSEAGQVCVPIKLEAIKKIFDILEKHEVKLVL